MKKEALKEEAPALLTYEEAAEFMRMTPGALRQRVAAGNIPAMCIVRLGGAKSSVRFRRKELEKWLLGN